MFNDCTLLKYLQIKNWKIALRQEIRSLDRQILSIEREELKVKMSVKEAAKKGNIDVCKVLAKSLVQSKRAKNRIHTSKAQINSVMMEIQNQQSMLKVAGCMQKSTAVMSVMSSLLRVPEMQETMAQLSKEMTKAGLMGEMMDDAFEAMEEDGVDEEADEEVDKVLYEITKGQLGSLPAVGTHEAAEAASDEEDAKVDALAARLAAIK